MKRRLPLTETRISLWTILSAGVLAVLVLACATWVVDDDGGAGVDYTTIQATNAIIVYPELIPRT